MSKAPRRDLVIAVNPGSTSTKIAIYRGTTCLACDVINHPKEELASFDGVAAQEAFRRDAVLAFLDEHGIRAGSLRGGGRPRRADQADSRRRLSRQRPR